MTENEKGRLYIFPVAIELKNIKPAFLPEKLQFS
jgi:hypothetical protein